MREGVFGIAFGARWNAPDSILRIDDDVLPDEVQFQPGVYLVKAGSAREELLRLNGAPAAPTAPAPTVGDDNETRGEGIDRPLSATKAKKAIQGIARVRLSIRNVPADKMRDVIKVAILPFAASGARVETTLEVEAGASDTVIPARNTRPYDPRRVAPARACRGCRDRRRIGELCAPEI